MGVNIENMAIIEQIFVDFAKKIEGSVWPANFLGVMQKSHEMKIILLVLAIFPFATLKAQSNFFKDTYVGLGLGYSKINNLYRGLEDFNNNDEDDIGGKIFYGVGGHKIYGMEFEYNNLGEFTYMKNIRPSVTHHAKAKFESIGISGVVKASISPRIQIFGKLGVHRWFADGVVHNGLARLAGNSRGNDVFGGLGVNMYLGNKVFARFEYQKFIIDES